MDQEDLPMKKLFISLAVIAAVLFSYITYANRNTMEMTPRQKILKAFYPAISGLNKLFGTNVSVSSNEARVKPVRSIYDLEITMINGSKKKMSDFRGKKLLLVNTASDCGYTGQYEHLQALYEKEGNNIEIIGFPANDFKEQEKGSDDDIATFCKRNYGVSFPLATKGSVVKGNEQQAVYQWLTHKEQNGWNGRQPSWNFCKYLVSEDGVLLNYFGPAVEPNNQAFLDALKK
jgi:glutathione peroxidase